MSTAQLPQPPVVPQRLPESGLPPWPVRRFTIDEYQSMNVQGTLDETELLEGWIVPKMPKGKSHDTIISLVDAAFRPLLTTAWMLRIQSAINTADSEPEPDLAVVKGPARQYFDHHPRPDEIAILVEVADTSLARDRDKARIYGRAGIPEYSIVNLVDEVVERFRKPTGPVADAGYELVDRLERGSELVVAIGDSELGRIPVADLLP